MAIEQKILTFGTNKVGTIGGKLMGYRFSPLEIPNLELWLNNDPDTMTLDGVNKVGQWNDLSGKNRHFTQATGINKPTYIPDVVNSQGGVFWQDRTSQRLISNFTTSIGRSNSIFIVWQQIPTNNIPFFIYDGGSVGARNLLFYSSGSIQVSSGTSMAVKTITANPINIVASEVFNNSTVTNSAYYENGVKIGADFNHGSNVLAGLTLGNAYVVQSPEETLNGYIHEVVVVSGVISSDIRFKLNSYFSSKYGL